MQIFFSTVKMNNKHMPSIHVTEGRDKGKRWLLAEAQYHDIGRSSENSIVIRDKAVSKRHAMLENQDGIWFIVDLDSKHGTFVNGERIAERKGLFSGDRIRIGESALLYKDG